VIIYYFGGNITALGLGREGKGNYNEEKRPQACVYKITTG
jgi:hypothetical protein